MTTIFLSCSGTLRRLRARRRSLVPPIVVRLDFNVHYDDRGRSPTILEARTATQGLKFECNLSDTYFTR